jgi:hypothetical protein
MLDAEAQRLCNAGRYERTDARRDTRAGSYSRKLQTQAGEVKLNVPKLRLQTFETAIIERYRRRESSVEEALLEMYLAGVLVRRVEDITEALWGTRVSPSTVSNFNKKIYASIEALSRRNRVEAQLGRRSEERMLLVATARHLRGRQGGGRELVGIAQAARPRRSAADRFRWLPRLSRTDHFRR